MMSFTSVFVLGSLLALFAVNWRLAAARLDCFPRHWLWVWAGKGLVVPLGIWLLLNAGSMPYLPPLNPHIALLRNSGSWGLALIGQTVLAVIMLLWFWTAVTFTWCAAQLVWCAPERREPGLAGFFWLLALPSLLVLAFALLGGYAVPAIALLWLAIAVYYASLPPPPVKLPPSYTRAIARLKFGKYAEAEAAIIAELDKAENDFNGWLMLADLYATHFHDLAEAEKTIHDLCADPAVTPSQISVALHRLADWHLELRGDPVAARRILLQISARLPDTHLDHMARLRAGQLPDSSEELACQQQPKTIHLPALRENLFSDDVPEPARLEPEKALAAAEACVTRLQQDPNDIAVREQFAHLLVEQLAKPDLAIEQIELLVALPDQPPARTAEWLALLAAWQLRHRHDAPAARDHLQRLIHEFPQTPHAFAAQRRLRLMDMEDRIHH